MIRKLPSLAVALLVAAGACGRGANHDADTALNNDLSLAAQAKAYRPLDSMSAAERGLNGTPAAAPITASRWVCFTVTSPCDDDKPALAVDVRRVRATSPLDVVRWVVVRGVAAAGAAFIRSAADSVSSG